MEECKKRICDTMGCQGDCETEKPELPVDNMVSLLDTDIRHLKTLLKNIETAKILIEDSLKNYEKIYARTYKQFYKEHTTIYKLLDKYIKNDESYYECLERILNTKAR